MGIWSAGWWWYDENGFSDDLGNLEDFCRIGIMVFEILEQHRRTVVESLGRWRVASRSTICWMPREISLFE